MTERVWLVLDDGQKLSWKQDTLEVKEGYGLAHVQGLSYPAHEGLVVAIIAERFLGTLQGLLGGAD